MEIYRAMRLIFPDPMVLLVSIVALVYLARRGIHHSARNHYSDEEATHSNPENTDTGEASTGFLRSTEVPRIPVKRPVPTASFSNIWMLSLLTVILVAAAGVIVPSLLSAFYLLSFYVTCTYWSSCKTVYNRKLAWTRIVLLIYSALHLCLFYLYQFEYAQSVLKDGSFIARLLGLNYLLRVDCTRPGEVIFPSDKPLFVFFAPIATLFVYLAAAVEIITNNDTNLHGSMAKWILLRNSNLTNATHRHSLLQRQRQQPADDLNHRDPSTSLNEPLLLNTNQNSGPDAVAGPLSQIDQSNVDQTFIDLDDLPTTETVALVQADEPEIKQTSRPLTVNAIEGGGGGRFSRPGGPTDRSQPVYDVFPFMIAARFRHVGGDVTLDENANFFSPLTQRPLLLSFLNSAIRNSYILTFIAMMAWSVVLRSWLSFILLLSACILWILPNSRLACLYCSPLIVAYGMCIILLQYIYCFDLTEVELPTYLPDKNLNLTEIGLHRWPVPVWPLSLQLTFLVFFWLNLRLFVLERSSSLSFSSHNSTRSVVHTTNTSAATTATAVGGATGVERDEEWREGGGGGGGLDDATAAAVAAATSSQYEGIAVVDNLKYRKFTSFLHNLCVRYWIALCCLTMLLFSLRRPVVIFRVVYMVLLLYFFTVFMVSYRFWRKQMPTFWWVYIIYSIAVLLCTYTYQFTFFPYYWQNGTGLSPQLLKAIGLEQFDSAELFDRLMMPVAFMVVIILQMHYFHKPFLEISSLDRYRDRNEQERLRVNQPASSSSPQNYTESLETQSNFLEDFHSVFNIIASSICRFINTSRTVAWRFAEVHWMKVVCLLVMLSVIKEVTITNIIPVIIMVVCFPFPYLHGFLVTFIFCFTGLQIVMKMLFQLDIVSDLDYANVIASGAPNNPAQPKSSITSLLPNGTGKWIGLDVVEDFPKYITPLALLLVACVFWHVIKYRQLQYYRKPGSLRPKSGIIFPEMTFSTMNEKLVNFLKCLANYTFYKLGLEICFCVTVIAACIRVDALSVLYLLLMLLFLFTHRRDICSRLWPAYMTFLGVLLVIQYAACSQIPSVLVESLPWDSNDNETIRLQQWLFLPSTSHQPDPRKLIVDFLQFMLVAAQWRVFKLEQRPDWESYGGGSNTPVLTDTLPGPNDRDFISTKESYLDYMRHAVFYWSYWLSLAIVFATGVSWITLFCLGYMILSFIYLWMGQNVMMRRRSNLLASWNVIVGYNFCVILAKCTLQLMGCVYWNRLVGHRICWLIQLFGVSCMNPVGWNDYAGYSTDIGCEIVSNGLHWDVVCFAVIIFQRKIFTTSSFRHVVFDLNVQSCFASRGAFLINRKLMQVISEQNTREKRDLERVQRKLDKIAQRQKEAGKNTANINEHYILIRSGDYYHFEGDPEDEEAEDETTATATTTSTSVTTPSSISETPLPQVLPPPPMHQGARTQAYPPESVQRHHLRAVWPSIDSAPLDALSNYTCPYSPTPAQPRRPTSRNPFRVSSVTRRRAPLEQTGGGVPHRRIIRTATAGGLSSSSSSSAAVATLGQPAFRTHRRLSSYPEAFRTAKRRARRAEQTAGIELQALSSTATAKSPLVGAVAKSGTTLLPRSLAASPPPKSHRRIASVGAIERHDTDATSPSLTTEVADSERADRGPSIEIENAPPEHLLMKTDLVSRSSVRPSVTFAAPPSPDPGTVADNDGEEEDDEETRMDMNDDEDDDDDYAMQTHMNPLQLLNQAMEHGMRSAARQYRRRNLAAYHQRSAVVDPNAVATTSGAEVEGEGGSSFGAQSGRMSAVSVRKSVGPLRPPLSKQNTVEGGGAALEEDPLAFAKTDEGYAKNDIFIQTDLTPFTLREGVSSGVPMAEGGRVPSDDSISQFSHISGDDVENKSESCWSRFKAGCLVMHIFFLSTIETTTRMLNSITREHRRIRRTIDVEKRKVKQKALYIFNRSSIDARVTLESVVLDVISGSTSPSRTSVLDPSFYSASSGSAARRQRLDATSASTTKGPQSSVPRPSSTWDAEEYDDEARAPMVVDGSVGTDGGALSTWEQREREFRRSRPSLFLLLIAVGNLVVVHSELVCYTILIINHMRSANVLSLVYPLMVFLWGMLSVPRPTKTFWISLITYTELIIIIKYIFQFRFIEFNSPDQVSATLAKTHWLPVIFGVEKSDSYAIWDLIQLLFIFLHRSYLKNYGLWRDDTEFRQDLIQAGEANKVNVKKDTRQQQQTREEAIAPSHSKSSSSQCTSSASLNPITKMRRFYLKMTDPRYNQKVDVYVYMFICEFLSFWIIIFGYQSFGPSTGMGDNAFEFIKTNRIPGPFIGMIIIQSLFIVADRALFLRKQVLGKFIFQILHVILIHVWLFFILPQITMTPFNVGSARALLYLVKCIYFGLSAYQIRSGYPRHILGNFLTKNYNYINLVLFKAYLIMPFLYEVRSVMDWMWTDSPLSLYHWMELEDIYAKVFVMKCWRRSEIEYPTPLGRKRSICVKYIVGLLILLFAFLCFWGPLVVASFIDTTYAINVPIECSQTLAIGGFPALYDFTSRENNLLHVNDSFLSEIRQCNALDQGTTGFVDNFKTEDVSNMTFDTTSGRVWPITPPLYRKLMSELVNEDSQMTITFHVACRRPPRAIDSSSTRVEQYFNRPLSRKERLEFNEVLSESLTNSSNMATSKSARLELAFPRFLFAQKDNLRNASGNLAQLHTFVNVSASLGKDSQSEQRWWVLEEIGLAGAPCYGTINNLTRDDMTYHSQSRSFSIIIFNERVSDNLLGKIFSSYGIIGMYAAYIFFASRLLRMIYSDISYQISLQELPHVDRLLNLCHDIYLVRENGKLYLEEQLFAKLIFLYRSSETMIKWTRHPKWLIDKFSKKPDEEEERSIGRRRPPSNHDDDNDGSQQTAPPPSQPLPLLRQENQDGVRGYRRQRPQGHRGTSPTVGMRSGTPGVRQRFPNSPPSAIR
ncbi:protein piezo2 [Echinococcus multilocularis]|uniref:Protein piezo2 n=1 Tax=Echinococcus multilocularis TaxID=6211 RepID=A0A068Y6C2_ECHMU|nr:protein piezo2 [Echinococcus multilocularis]